MKNIVKAIFFVYFISQAMLRIYLCYVILYICNEFIIKVSMKEKISNGLDISVFAIFPRCKVCHVWESWLIIDFDYSVVVFD